MAAAAIDIRIEDQAWRSEGRSFAPLLRGAARAALHACGCKGALTVLLADDARLGELNARFRGKSGPTNVLSFPAASGSYLGDLALAHGVIFREAQASGKSLRDHAIHLVVHGVLHLLGHDHQTPREAHAMETLETAILAQLGVADPYRSVSPFAKTG
jgi:probable rRNA maturation factor